jgi:hypothetical protein
MPIRQTVAMSAVVLTLGLGVARTGAATDDAKRQSTLDATVQFGAPQPQTPPVNVVVPDEVTIRKGSTVTVDRQRCGTRDRHLQGQQSHYP